MTRAKAVRAFVTLALETGHSVSDLWRAPKEVLGEPLFRWWKTYLIAKSPKVIANFQNDCYASHSVERREREEIANTRVTLTPYGAIYPLITGLMPAQREKIRAALEDWESGFGAEQINLAILRGARLPRPGRATGKRAKDEFPEPRVTGLFICGIKMPHWFVRLFYP